MIDTRALKAEIVRNGLTQGKLAQKIGISSRTLTQKLKRGIFGSDEIERMINVLNIHDPVSIFFAPNVTLKDTIHKERS